jgi:hypothetical protein
VTDTGMVQARSEAGDGEIRFYFDPVCPFAWITSKWVRMVQAERGYEVDWRFISLRLLNAAVDYDSQFPAGYEDGHTAGLRLLRVAAQVRAAYGADQVARLYEALGARIFDMPTNPGRPADHGSRQFVAPVLAELGFDAGLADALEDTTLDIELQDETDQALALTGKDVGTPIIHFQPPEGTAFFGPVISRLPSQADAGRLWDHVIGLAGFAGFAELKRSLRERPQLASFGVKTDGIGLQEDWHGGSRRLKK